MTDFSLRTARPEDEAAVEHLLRASYSRLMAKHYPPALLARVLPMITRPQPRLLASGSYYLVGAEDLPVGCGGWSFEEPGTRRVEPGVAHLRHFATHPGWTGRGVGREIYGRCEAQARAAGARRFECYSSLNGEGFYAALGFARVAAMEVEMGPHLFPSIHMRRPLGRR